MDGPPGAPHPVEQFLVEQAATASWKIERADRVETARLGAIMRSVPDELARQQQEEAAALGRRLIGESGEAPPARLDDALRTDPLLGFVSGGLKPAAAGVLNHAEAIVLRLESTAAGCVWLLGRWAALRTMLEGGETWDMNQLVEAVRLFGQHPLAQSPGGWEKLHDKLMACEDPELEENCRRTLACQLDSSVHRDECLRPEVLRRTVERATARLTALAMAHDERTEAEASAQPDRLSFEPGTEGERLRRYQFGCGRMLHRSLEMLIKLRRTLGDTEPDAPEPARPDPLPPAHDPDPRPEQPGDEVLAETVDDQPDAQVLMLRCSGAYSICDPEFLGKAVADDPFQRARPSWGLQTFGQVLQFRLIARLTDRLAEAVGPLVLPPALLLDAQAAARNCCAR